MRTTVDHSDELYRRAKAEGALSGRKFKDLVEEALRRVLQAREPEILAKETPTPSVHDLMRGCRGIAKDAPADYAINPKYMEGLAGDSRDGGRYRPAGNRSLLFARPAEGSRLGLLEDLASYFPAQKYRV